MPALARRAASVGKGVDDAPPSSPLPADPASVVPADVAMARLAAANAGSTTWRCDSPYDVLWGRVCMVGTRGAELTRWLARRRIVVPDAPAAASCFLEKERKSVKEERLVRNASSGSSIDGRLPVCVLSLVANAAMLNGVPGRLTEKTLSPSSLVESSSSGVAAATDLASTSVGKCFSSGTTLL